VRWGEVEVEVEVEVEWGEVRWGEVRWGEVRWVEETDRWDRRGEVVWVWVWTWAWRDEGGWLARARWWQLAAGSWSGESRAVLGFSKRV
jgi:hypothetical protein